MSRRRSTVHDAAALRLHPSGVRVPPAGSDVRPPTSSVVTKKNKTTTLARRDVRGNWIATDAGGDGKITKRRKVVGRERKEPREVEVSVEGNADAEDADEIPVKVFKDARANRRIAFENDFTFLSQPSGGSDTSIILPSSDFLKCIHHFASQHYASNGQLFDSAGQYRKEKKEKRRLRMLQAEASGSNDSGVESNDQEGGEDDPPAERQDDPLEEAPPDSDSKSKNKGKGKAEPKRKRKKVTQRDMYKAFEGSALLCVGMLLQSHISSTLAQRPMPEGWEEEWIAADRDQEDPDSPVRNRKKKTMGTTAPNSKVWKGKGQLEPGAIRDRETGAIHEEDEGDH